MPAPANPDESLTSSAPPSPRTPTHPHTHTLLFLAFPLAALLLLWPVLLGGQVLVPAEYLKGFLPWSGGAPDLEKLPQWNVLQWDGMGQFYPWRMELARAFGEGRIPLWNPYALCGTPFLANSQSAPLYPIHGLFALPLGSVAAKMGWIAWLHLSLAGGFAYLLARHAEARPAAAVIGGLAFELSGFAVSWLELPSFISVSCWIPLAILCVSRACRAGSLRWALGGGAAVGMMMLAGHLQVAFYGLAAAALASVWEIGLLTRERASVGARARALALSAFSVALGMGMTAAQLLPSLELSRVSHRVGAASEAGYAGYVKLAMPLQNWITLLVPDYYGLPGRGDFWGFWNYLAPNTVEYAGHVGAAAALLALVGLAAARRVRGAGMWIALALIALLLASGSPLNRLTYFGVPGFAQSGSPARVLVLLCLAQAMLAALGAELLLGRAEEDWKKAVVPLWFGAAAFAVLVGALHLAAQASLPSGFSDAATFVAQISVPALGRALAWSGALAFLVSLFAWLLRDNAQPVRSAALASVAALVVAGGSVLISGPYNQTAAPEAAYPESDLTRALRGSGARVATLNREWSLNTYAPAIFPPNASLAYGWRDAQGYDSLALGAYRRLAGMVAGPGGDAAPEANGNIVFIKPPALLAPLLGARYLVAREPQDAAWLKLAAGFPPGPPYVYEISGVPESYAVTRWRVASDTDAAAQLRALKPEQMIDTAFVAEGEAVGKWNPEAMDPLPGLPTETRRLKPGHVVVSAEPKLPALIVLTEAAAPGWRAWVQERGRQGREARILRTNIGFQGVVVGSGPVTVEWRYQPASFRVGLFLSLAAVATLLAGAFATRRTRS